MARKLPKAKVPESAWFPTPAWCNCGAAVKVGVDERSAHTFRCANGHEAAVGEQLSVGSTFAMASKEDVRLVKVSQLEEQVRQLTEYAHERYDKYLEAREELEQVEARLRALEGES